MGRNYNGAVYGDCNITQGIDELARMGPPVLVAGEYVMQGIEHKTLHAIVPTIVENLIVYSRLAAAEPLPLPFQKHAVITNAR